MTRVNITKKKTKHLRLTIKPDKTIQITAPLSCSEKTIQDFLQKKEKWIHTKLLQLEHAKTWIDIWPDEVLLHAQIYTFSQYSETQKNQKNHINYDTKSISSRKNLLDKETLQSRYLNYAKVFLSKRARHFSELHDLPFEKLFIRNQSTKRWTCSTQKNIWLNRRLVLTPLFVTDYVICHELAHLKHMNHSKQFRDFVDTLYQDKEKAIEWIKTYWSSLW